MNAVYLYICWTSIYTFTVRGSDTEFKKSSSVRQRAPVGVIELWKLFSRVSLAHNIVLTVTCDKCFHGDYCIWILYVCAVRSWLRWRVLPLKQQNLNCPVFTLSCFFLPLKSLVKRRCAVAPSSEGHAERYRHGARFCSFTEELHVHTT